MSNLVSLLNSSPYDFYFLVVDKFLDIKPLGLSNFTSISPDSLKITLDQKNSGRLLSHPVVNNFIENNSKKSGRTPAIIPFKPSAKIDLICQQKQWKLISNPASINRLLEDKIKFYEICIQNNLPIIPSEVLPFNQTNFLLCQKKFGQKIVLQTHFGWAGNSSYLTTSWLDISQRIAPDTMVKFSPYLPGCSLINNCCLTASGLIQSPPGLQYTGLAKLTSNPLATVGRQWPAFVTTDISNQIKKITSDFSEIIKQYNYRGFFGLDFFVSDNKVYLIECNPRLTASFALYTELEIKNNLTPLFFHHLAEFIDIDFPTTDRFDNSQIVGSEITSKNTIGTTVKKYQDSIAFSLSCDPINIDPKIIAKVL